MPYIFNTCTTHVYWFIGRRNPSSSRLTALGHLSLPNGANTVATKLYTFGANILGDHLIPEGVDQRCYVHFNVTVPSRHLRKLWEHATSILYASHVLRFIHPHFASFQYIMQAQCAVARAAFPYCTRQGLHTRPHRVDLRLQPTVIDAHIRRSLM